MRLSLVGSEKWLREMLRIDRLMISVKRIYKIVICVIFYKKEREYVVSFVIVGLKM